MKSIISKAMMLFAIAATLLSFSSKFGGEGFEISLNGKLLLQQFGSDLNTVKNLQMDKNLSNEQLTIKYYHCGRVGRNRIVTIKDGQDKILKEWHFADANPADAAMNCDVKEVFNLKKTNSSILKLYYSSTELPKGRLLTNIVLGSSSVAKW